MVWVRRGHVSFIGFSKKILFKSDFFKTNYVKELTIEILNVIENDFLNPNHWKRYALGHCGMLNLTSSAKAV